MRLKITAVPCVRRYESPVQSHSPRFFFRGSLSFRDRRVGNRRQMNYLLNWRDINTYRIPMMKMNFVGRYPTHGCSLAENTRFRAEP